MDELEQLCRDVAVEILGWEIRPNKITQTEWVFIDGVGQGPTGIHGLALTWNDAGRVVEAMRARRYSCASLHIPPEHLDTSEFGGSHIVHFVRLPADIAGIAQTACDSYPEAVFRAALAAVRQENDNG